MHRWIIRLLFASAAVTSLVVASTSGTSPTSARTADTAAVAGTDQEDPQPVLPMPVRLVIPSLRVNALIEDVAFDSDGGMASPGGPDTVGWFAPGFRPGDPGSAVIAGHVDWVDRAAVFWFVKDLAPGDEVDVIYDDGSSAAFAVDGVESYSDTDAPMDQIFAAGDVPHLNLLTCGGTFNRATHNYDHRTVVYTTLIQP